jgi:hypothetical protein
MVAVHRNVPTLPAVSPATGLVVLQLLTGLEQTLMNAAPSGTIASFLCKEHLTVVDGMTCTSMSLWQWELILYISLLAIVCD